MEEKFRLLEPALAARSLGNAKPRFFISNHSGSGQDHGAFA